jgi:uncharacterized protein (TIGR02145 family)
LGIFSSEITNLTPCTRYYARAYATNSAGTGYASQDITWQIGEFSIGYGNISSISSNSASWTATLAGSNCVSVTQRGAVWSTSPNPTISLATKTENGSGMGAFTSNITGLVPNTTYHVRFYVTLQNGGSDVRTSYFGDRTFTTTNAFVCGTSTIADIDGNSYNTVLIGSQCWMKENLKVTKYRNATSISNVTGNSDWSLLTTGAWCFYNNDAANNTVYGKLYNWFTTIDNRGICPTGWHVPTDAEWTILTNNLGGLNAASGKMRATGTTYWNSPNEFSNNESGFTALPGGMRNAQASSVFSGLKDNASFWSATEISSNAAWSRSPTYFFDVFLPPPVLVPQVMAALIQKQSGLSIRCLKDANPAGETVLFIPNKQLIADKLDYSDFILDKRDNLSNRLNIYPNPNNGKFTISFIDFTKSKPINMILMDGLGRTIKLFSTPDLLQNMEMDLSSSNGNLFFLKVIYEGEILTKRIIKY